jgi:hypothetical protein
MSAPVGVKTQRERAERDVNICQIEYRPVREMNEIDHVTTPNPVGVVTDGSSEDHRERASQREVFA